MGLTSTPPSRVAGSCSARRRIPAAPRSTNRPGRLDDQAPFIADFAKTWRAASKIVYSTSLEAVSSARTRIQRDFDPAAIRRMKAEAVSDIGVGGPGLAAQAIQAGLVDEYHLFVAPVVVGGGTRCLPDGVRLDLELVEERRFGNGMVYLKYRAAR